MRRVKAGSGLRLVAVLAGLALAVMPAPGGMRAQQLGLAQAAILTISAERLFAETAFGRRAAQEIEAESAVLAAENRRIEAELSVEERDLTERRPGMDPEAFRALADAFDEKVQDFRRAQDAKARALGKSNEAAKLEFLKAARPVLEELMRESGAGVILERSSVFLSSNATDVTELAIERIDAAIGDGTAPGK